MHLKWDGKAAVAGPFKRKHMPWTDSYLQLPERCLPFSRKNFWNLIKFYPKQYFHRWVIKVNFICWNLRVWNGTISQQATTCFTKTILSQLVLMIVNIQRVINYKKTVLFFGKIRWESYEFKRSSFPKQNHTYNIHTNPYKSIGSYSSTSQNRHKCFYAAKYYLTPPKVYLQFK